MRVIIFLHVIVGILFSTPGKAQELPSSEPSAMASAIEDGSQLKALARQDAVKIKTYKPIYFAYGDPSSKLQFSFRVPLFEEFPLNFAYSQIIFWELQQDSKPFLDATYTPEFFYRWQTKDETIRSFDFGFWEHNSNGKAGEESRSYDQTYLRANVLLNSRSWATQLSGKIRYLYNNDEENRDIYDYIGPFEFEIKFLQLFDSWFDRLEVVLNINPGGKYSLDWDKGGYQASFNFHIGGLKVVPTFYVQYYHGYAETLINYSEKVDELRAGLMF